MTVGGVPVSGPAIPACLLDVRNVVKRFPVYGGVFNRVRGYVHAVNGVSLVVRRGEMVGVVGESGCGKSTLGKLIVRLIEPTAGAIIYDGTDITSLGHAAMMPLRRRMQIIFQDPYASLNPRMTVRRMLREVLMFHGVVAPAEVDDAIGELIARVGLRPDARDRYPHEFSGGQRQRIGIARALASRPEFIVADEPVSALDVSVQAQVLNLLMDLKEQMGLTMLLISHDLKVIEHMCDRVLVMYLGHIVEEVARAGLETQACHPYTRALLGANPVPDPDVRRPLTVLRGEVPSPLRPPPGCPFAGRCVFAMERCRREMPPLVPPAGSLSGHRVACWAVQEGRDTTQGAL